VGRGGISEGKRGTAVLCVTVVRYGAFGEVFRAAIGDFGLTLLPGLLRLRLVVFVE
jgi:hypothetical protein